MIGSLFFYGLNRVAVQRCNNLKRCPDAGVDFCSFSYNNERHVDPTFTHSPLAFVLKLVPALWNALYSFNELVFFVLFISDGSVWSSEQ